MPVLIRSRKFKCIGQNIGILEVYKAVPSLLWTFDFELVDPSREWQFSTGSFVTVKDVDVRVKRRSD